MRAEHTERRITAAMLEEGRKFCSCGHVKIKYDAIDQAGIRSIRAKTIDPFHCADRVELQIRQEENILVYFSCSCGNTRNGYFCRHCSAVLAETAAANDPAEAQPDAVQDTEAAEKRTAAPAESVLPEYCGAADENAGWSDPAQEHGHNMDALATAREEVGRTPQEETEPTAAWQDSKLAGERGVEADGTQPFQPLISPLQDIRVYIGDDQKGNPVYWEFGNPQLGNRHLLITGTSGQGKTYCIQTMLLELARQGIPCFIFDYTDGFLPGKLEPEFEAAMQGKITQQVAVIHHIPLNPFLKREMEIPGIGSYREQTMDVAGRLADILSHVYSFGEQQRAALYQACKEGIESYDTGMTFSALQKCLTESPIREAKSVLSKMAQFFDNHLFDLHGRMDWGSMRRDAGHIMVFQLTGLDKKIQTIITEILLWDAWYYFMKAGDPDHPFVVVLDEAQCLSFQESAPAARILREGRKYGWSAWFATQFTKGALSTEEISLLQQAAERIAFKPTGEEMNQTAAEFAELKSDHDLWISVLKNMKKGQCIVQGERVLENGEFGHAEAALVKVASFADRVTKQNCSHTDDPKHASADAVADCTESP